jgi:hypothetical protein
MKDGEFNTLVADDLVSIAKAREQLACSKLQGD